MEIAIISISFIGAATYLLRKVKKEFSSGDCKSGCCSISKQVKSTPLK